MTMQVANILLSLSERVFPRRATPLHFAIFATISLFAIRAEAEFKLKESDRFFFNEVKPLLISRCASCHGPDKAEGGLRLDSREAALKGGDSGPAVVPGKPISRCC